MKSVLIASKSPELLKSIGACFSIGTRVETAGDKDAALEYLTRRSYDGLFLDLEMLLEEPSAKAPGKDYNAALQTFWRHRPSLDIILITPQDMIRDAVRAVKEGASNYVSYPINPDEVRLVVEEIHEDRLLQSELDYLRGQFWQDDSLDIVQTRSATMRAVFEKIRSAAPTKTTILLSGETGTGKSILARLIHRHSNRREAQFISVHCGAIPETLIESELFGHEKGAFTGAHRRKLGKFEIAMGGTIFLDEIGTITPAAQIKLLTILQEGIFQRVGGEEYHEANVRVIAATNADLKQMCDNGLFRKDLYYRLNVFPIEIPPLRERTDDLPFFIRSFLKKMNQFSGKTIQTVHPQVLDAFQKYGWPGNIRELENLIERAYILETSDVLTPESFPAELLQSSDHISDISINGRMTLAQVRRLGIQEIERRYLKELLSRNKGRINASANEAGISTRQLHKLMQKYNIQKEDFKL
jgi:DNA-binding NtrC family response regulator